MSIARHHAEWLSLIEISGPFLSLPVLLEAFPQGLDADDPALAAELRAAYEEWADNMGGLQPDPAIHTQWVRYVLGTVLEMEGLDVLAEGQAVPAGLKAAVAEHHETIRPDMLVRDPDTGQPRLLVQVYSSKQDLEKVVPGRNWKASPATRLMELLHATEIRLGLATNGEQWLLVSAQRGETTGYASWFAGLWLEERLTLRAFRSLLGVQRFFGVPEDQTLAALLAASAKDQQEVTDQLGYQVRQAVEILIQAIDKADQDRGRTLLYDVTEARLYEAALTVMMRLVFLLAAEERGLLLLGDPVYDQNYAVSTLRAQLRELADQVGEELLERRYDAWSRLLATFRAVYGGARHENMRLLAYGGSLFDPDRFPFLEGRRGGKSWRGAAADPLPINNRTTLHLLDALQMLRVKAPGGGPAQARRLSFRALDIEQIGHVYEGLLDHVAVRADAPVVGLQGTKNKEPEIALARLEQFVDVARFGKSGGDLANRPPFLEEKLLDFLQAETGRSRSALKNSLQQTLDGLREQRLRIACGNDDALYRRVWPWAGVIRDDDYGLPVVIPAGSVYVTAGATRRATGTHYTPRSLTEPIVQHTLEPLVYVGPAEGWPREKWQLRTPAELLALKVCDMAMGSGAFLVQADRYLAERLVEAWGKVASGEYASGEFPNDQPPATSRQLQITPEGLPASGDPNETIIPDNDEERLALARRLVADRCLYGVDKNHLAVEMGKLSLWLITLDKNRPFTFLDHALRHGDSLIGADKDMFLRWSESLKGTVGPLYYEENEKALARALQKRQALQAFTVRDVRDAAEKGRLLAEAEAAMARIKRASDLIVGVRLLDDLNAAEQEAWLAELLIEHTAKEEMTSDKARRALQAAQALPAFHWPFEFPEVFAQGGFSAFVGNPPFIGGKRILETLGEHYKNTLFAQFPHAHGNADYCALFFLKSFSLLGQGCVGLIATNTIAQGDTRETGLHHLISGGGTIYRAVNNQPWPGQASVLVNVVFISNISFSPPFLLDGQSVKYISSFLHEYDLERKPYELNANANLAFKGHNVYGKGFILSTNEKDALVDNHDSEVIQEYINGSDLNSRFDQSGRRWVINFHNWPLHRTQEIGWTSADKTKRKKWIDSHVVPQDYPYPVASDFPKCLRVAENLVKPERDKNRRKSRREKWWQFGDYASGLVEKIQGYDMVLVVAQTVKYHNFVFKEPQVVFDQKLIVFALNRFSHFALLQSNIHTYWVLNYGSTLGNSPVYTPTNCFETFPFPLNISALETVGETYYEYRRKLMLECKKGLTDTYNRFHDPDETAPDIARLRQLHVEMDNAVAAAYGWEDLVLGHGFHETAQDIRYTISEAARREVLTRLLQLNHQQYAAEVKAGLHEKKGGRQKAEGRKKKAEGRGQKKNDGQLSLL